MSERPITVSARKFMLRSQTTLRSPNMGMVWMAEMKAATCGFHFGDGARLAVHDVAAEVVVTPTGGGDPRGSPALVARAIDEKVVRSGDELKKARHRG